MEKIDISKLTDQQEDAFSQFKKLRVGALFMKMGTGKTRVALELVNNSNCDFLLYLTPVSTKENIKQEIEKWGINCDYDIVGYESIASSDEIYFNVLNELDNYENKFIIADESIFIKNKRTKRFTRSVELRKKCQYALILNGTPIVKDEFDLINQMNFLSEKIIPFRGYDIVQNFFEEHQTRKYGREMTYYKFYEPNRPILVKLIKPYCFYSDLKFDKNENVENIWVNVDNTSYEKVFEKIYEESLENMELFIKMFTVLNKEAAICPEKNKKVADYIKDKKVICFCNYIEEIKQIEESFGGQCYKIDGSTSLNKRNEIIKAFEDGDNKPLILSLGVGSYSLNLQFCNEIVYSSLSFDFAKMEQSKYRIKRTGQVNDIKYTYILSDLKINQLIYKNLDKKQSLKELIETILEDEDINKFIETNLKG